MQNYDLVIASDHGGFNLKLAIIKFLHGQKIKVKDLGTDSLESVDYPDYSKLVTEEIIEGTSQFGILICGTGIGMSIAANRNSAIRAALCIDVFMAERARLHNDANILIIGSKITKEKVALEMVEKFLNVKFEGGRHSRRLNKIS